MHDSENLFVSSEFESLYKLQYGFQHKQSNSNALIKLTEYTIMHTDQGDFVWNLLLTKENHLLRQIVKY